jgi:tRNA G18 (ribose-2'-O)-methylase SpoU
MEYLYGAHTVEASVNFNFRKNLDLFVQMSYKENTPDHIQRIIDAAKSKNIKVKYLTKDKLDKFTGARPHNGVVLKSEPRDYIYIKNFTSFAEKFIAKPEGNLLILLDQIVDPQNFGSIIRSAFFLGSDAILLNKKNKPPISSTVCKVSSGASECTEMYAVKSVRKFLGEALNKGWTVVTTSIEKEHDVQMRLNEGGNKDKEEEDTVNNSTTNNIEAKNISLDELKLNSNNNVILVLGSEASGITSDLSGVSNYNVYIPPMLNKELSGKYPYNIIDSLNVGVSAGIIINTIKTQLKFNTVENNSNSNPNDNSESTKLNLH